MSRTRLWKDLQGTNAYLYLRVSERTSSLLGKQATANSAAHLSAACASAIDSSASPRSSLTRARLSNEAWLEPWVFFFQLYLFRWDQPVGPNAASQGFDDHFHVPI